MKTFEQCCDEVAKKLDIVEAKKIIFAHRLSKQLFEEAAELYATELSNEKVKEAVKLAIEHDL